MAYDPIAPPGFLISAVALSATRLPGARYNSAALQRILTARLVPQECESDLAPIAPFGQSAQLLATRNPNTSGFPLV